MEENRTMLILLMVLAGLGFLLQLIGFFGPGWLVYELKVNVNYQYFTGHGNQYGGGAYGGTQGGSYGGSQYGRGSYGQQYGGNYPNPNYPTGGSYGGGYPQYGGSYGNNPGYGGSYSNLGTPSTVVKMKAGLWAFHSCVWYSQDREDCQMTYYKIKNAIGMTSSSGQTSTRSESEKLFDEFTSQKVLATLAMILSVLGLLFNILLFTSLIESSLCKRTMCGVSWILSAILNLAAIGVQGKNIADLHDRFEEMDRVLPGMYKFEVSVPWSLVIIGFGAFFALLNAVLTLFMLPRCVSDSDQGSYTMEKHERGSYSEAPMKAMNEYT